MDLQVELIVDGRSQWVALQDLSRTGMFVQLSRPLAVGSHIHVAMQHEGRRVVSGGRITHLLAPPDALRLGRYPGVGIAFRDGNDPSDQMFAIAVDQLCRTQRASSPSLGLHAVIADADARFLSRMSNAMSEAGFSVATASTGMEAVAACLRQRPDVVVVARDLPVVDGFRVLDTLAQDPTLAAVPVIVTSDDLNDLAPAFDRGALDFIAKPYTTLELIVRSRRLAVASPRPTERVVLAGTLNELGLPALLMMLELERKTGRLALTGEHVAWIDIAEGKIVGAGSATGMKDTRTIVMDLLSWTHGTFEMTNAAGPYDTDSTIGITPLLLAHACAYDEALRDKHVA